MVASVLEIATKRPLTLGAQCELFDVAGGRSDLGEELGH